jgi:hypothetical protein
MRSQRERLKLKTARNSQKRFVLRSRDGHGAVALPGFNKRQARLGQASADLNVLRDPG